MNNSQPSPAAKEMLAEIKLKREEASFIARALSILSHESEDHDHSGRVTKLILSLRKIKQSSQQLVINVKDFSESLQGEKKLKFLTTSNDCLGGLDSAIYWADIKVAKALGGPTVTVKQS